MLDVLTARAFSSPRTSASQACDRANRTGKIMKDAAIAHLAPPAAGRADETPKERADRRIRVLELVGGDLPQDERDRIATVLRREAGDFRCHAGALPSGRRRP